MPRPWALRIASLLAFAATVAACAGITEIGPDGGAGPRLAPDEQSAVRSQVDRAVEARRWKIAWNSEIEAGADRAALERIALDALQDRSRHAGDMRASLRKRWGDLTPGGRARVDAWVAEARKAGLWSRAVELELLSADDPPKFAKAWAVYEAAPVDRSEDLLADIKSAREDFGEEGK